MFPKMGKTFPNEDRRRIDRVDFQAAVAAALRRELGGSHRAIKTVMRWTGVSERTAKNWFSGTHVPSGQHLVELMHHSNEVLATVLELSGRNSHKAAIQLADLRDTCLRMASIADEKIES